jgi:hypothetical protein
MDKVAGYAEHRVWEYITCFEVASVAKGQGMRLIT